MDEQDPENPFKPFPKRRDLALVLRAIHFEKILFIEKSRTMMASWLVSAYMAHRGFNQPAIRTIFQSQDEDRAVKDIEYVKCLWEQSLPELQERWPLSKPLHQQPKTELELANKSSFKAIVGNPDKVRSEHPTHYVLDEAAIVVNGEESLNVAAATRCLKIIALSSAKRGWFGDLTQPALPIDWPDYPEIGEAVA